MNVVGKALVTSIQTGVIRLQMTRNMSVKGQCKCRLHCSVVSSKSLHLPALHYTVITGTLLRCISMW